MKTNSRLYICFSLLFLIAIGLTITSPLLSEISNTYDVNISLMGIIFTSNTLGYLIFTLIGGMLADEYGKKRILLVSLTGYAISLYLFQLAGNFKTILFFMIFIGGFTGVIQSVTNAFIGEIDPEKATFNINIGNAVFGLGALVGPISTGIILTKGYEWKICYKILCILTIIIIVLFNTIKIEVSSSKKNCETPNTKFDIKYINKSFIIVCITLALYNGSEVGSWGWLSTFLKSNFEFSTLKSSIAVSIFWISMTLGRILCSYLSLKYKIEDLLIRLAYLSAVATILSAISYNEYIAWFSIVFMGITYSGQCPLMMSYANNLTKSSSSTLFSILSISCSVGIMVVPPLIGIFNNYLGSQASMIFPTLLLFIVGILFSYNKRISK